MASGQIRSAVLLSPDGCKVAVKGLGAFCKANGLNASGLSDLLAGRRKTHKGWTVWEPDEDPESDPEGLFEQWFKKVYEG